MNKKILYSKVLWIIVSIILAGCASTKPPLKPLDPSQSPAQHVGDLAATLAQAKQEQVNLLSPVWFAKARESYHKANAALEQGGRTSKILNHAARAMAQLSQAEKFADSSRYHLAEVIESREMAIKAHADRFAKAFSALDEDFKTLTRAVEKNDFTFVRKKKTALNAAYRDLELKAITAGALDNVRQLLSMLVEKGAHEIAPESYALARQKLDEAVAYTAGSRYDVPGIQARSESARFYTERLQQIAAAARTIDTMQPEAIALWMESLLHKTAERLEEPDRRNLPLEVQQEHIANAIDVLRHSYELSLNHINKKDARIDRLEERLAETEGQAYRIAADKDRLAAEKEHLVAEKQRLAAEKRFNALFTTVQELFAAHEADVYKRNDDLIVRLKAMRFPVGRASILPENYGLLAKVKKAIQTFGQPDVIIEGHTDSTGAQAKNERLSLERAEAVRQYLIANGTLSKGKISARGYGSRQPLASNETEEGRAMNRRIDLVIMPVTEDGLKGMGWDPKGQNPQYQPLRDEPLQ